MRCPHCGSYRTVRTKNKKLVQLPGDPVMYDCQRCGNMFTTTENPGRQPRQGPKKILDRA